MIDTKEGAELSRVQYTRFTDALRTLSGEEWAAPTDCTDWTVKDVAAHVLGNLECQRSTPEFLRQAAAGWRRNPKSPYDGLNAYQVDKAKALPPADLVDRLTTILEPALRHRVRIPKALRLGIRPKLDVAGRVSMAFVLDTIYTRDAFMHRVDVARATGHDLVLDDVERRIVADMVEEWAARHGKPYRLTLTGPAGGTFGNGGEEITMDAVEWSRVMSGRGSGDGLLRTLVQY